MLTADLGFSVFEDFEAARPKQYLNTGCSEANTVSMAAGLALSGKRVFVYSIIPFITMRCFEQVRVDMCMHKADVTLVGVGGGLAYGQLGPTHHAIEDISIMRSLPEMTVICPGDPVEARLATEALLKHKGPAYLRFNRSRDTIVHESDPVFEIGKAIQVRDGKDLTLVSTGGLLPTAVEAAEILSKSGKSVRVLSMHTVKPLDTDAIDDAIQDTGHIFSLEEHNVIGGLGSAIAEHISESSQALKAFKRFAIQDKFTKTSGSQNDLRELHGLTAPQIASVILDVLAA